jgi:hypothetical protein
MDLSEDLSLDPDLTFHISAWNGMTLSEIYLSYTLYDLPIEKVSPREYKLQFSFRVILRDLSYFSADCGTTWSQWYRHGR